jgi:uncharacterized protein (DUF1501 family)
VPERIFYTSLDGFDTHAAQVIGHGPLLRTLGDALAAFQADLQHQGHSRRVASLVFSEFGRRVKENGSQGTDHGAAAPLFLIGEQVKAGLVGEHPDFDVLDDGDLRFHTDFRAVYAALLTNWLGVPARDVLEVEFAPADVFA